MDNTENTEKRILEAAKTIFHRKGFSGTRMQEIANEAGINKAMLHYYYRNKETLFERVFDDSFSKMVGKLMEIFYSEMSFQQKLEVFLQYYITFILSHSYIPSFIFNTFYEKPDQLREFFLKKNFYPQKLLEHIRKQIREEFNIEIDPIHIYINILSLVIFPVIARPLIQNINGFTDEQMAIFYEQRKQHVPAFIVNALKGYEK